MNHNPTELITARRRQIESEIARLTALINDLKAELPDLAAAERVIQRLSGQGENPAPTSEPMVSNGSVLMATAKPPNIPTIPEMIIEALKDARNRGFSGLEPKVMAEYIATRWWPNVPGTAISPIAWRMSKRGDLIKEGALYKLLSRNAEAADASRERRSAASESNHQH